MGIRYTSDFELFELWLWFWFWEFLGYAVKVEAAVCEDVAALIEIMDCEAEDVKVEVDIGTLVDDVGSAKESVELENASEDSDERIATGRESAKVEEMIGELGLGELEVVDTPPGG